ncbi:hypothetical protein [Williamsoniiplasma lucivorax]|uniref:Uncharacterized protein n=1 Tax=Williamsoniiplasma lucivorax TaxID=209274 RepID=A0A2S5RDP8_9MOLU|nr:hypothetical protein [Williamsoniiplasma lucivorax]PPE05443.1 hypothetical protein ELUCI_v1c05360 [Williamsoniiplasma lucivorax]
MFKELMQTFNKNRKKDFFSTKFNDLTLKWKFSDLPIFLNKTEFVACLEITANFQFSSLTKQAIFNRITKITALYDQVNDVTVRYLGELNNDSLKINGYNAFLKNTYALLKIYINDALIPWIFQSALNLNCIKQKVDYDRDLYIAYADELVSYELQKFLKVILKILITAVPTDQTFALLNEAYEQDLISKSAKLKIMKQNARINEKNTQ